MAKISGSNKKTMGSIRAKAGLPAKAGRRRPPHIEKNKRGDYETVNKESKTKPKPNFGIVAKSLDTYSIYDATADRLAERQYNLGALRNPKNKDRIEKAKGKLIGIARSIHKTDPFWFGKMWKDFKMGWISLHDIEKGRV